MMLKVSNKGLASERQGGVRVRPGRGYPNDELVARLDLPQLDGCVSDKLLERRHGCEHHVPVLRLHEDLVAGLDAHRDAHWHGEPAEALAVCAACDPDLAAGILDCLHLRLPGRILPLEHLRRHCLHLHTRHWQSRGSRDADPQWDARHHRHQPPQHCLHGGPNLGLQLGCDAYCCEGLGCIAVLRRGPSRKLHCAKWCQWLRTTEEHLEGSDP
mmetsp:Transcript_58720/g.152810  ORF Transcript_58720/g.152810 Transcript_58720/m.152810 type:complete len:214 (-) Transcript_58720:163-804(-)